MTIFGAWETANPAVDRRFDGTMPNILPDWVLAITVFLKPPGGIHQEPQDIAYIPELNNKEPPQNLRELFK